MRCPFSRLRQSVLQVPVRPVKLDAVESRFTALRVACAKVSTIGAISWMPSARGVGKSTRPDGRKSRPWRGLRMVLQAVRRRACRGEQHVRNARSNCKYARQTSLSVASRLAPSRKSPIAISAPCFRTMSPRFAFGARPRSSLHALRVSASAARPANLPAPPAAGIVSVPMACFLINMIADCSVELNSEVAMNPHEGSVPFGSREPISFGVRNGRSCCRPDIASASALSTKRPESGLTN